MLLDIWQLNESFCGRCFYRICSRQAQAHTKPWFWLDSWDSLDWCPSILEGSRHLITVLFLSREKSFLLSAGDNRALVWCRNRTLLCSAWPAIPSPAVGYHLLAFFSLNWEENDQERSFGLKPQGVLFKESFSWKWWTSMRIYNEMFYFSSIWFK